LQYDSKRITILSRIGGGASGAVAGGASGAVSIIKMYKSNNFQFNYKYLKIAFTEM
jgi:hypothetical protein